MLLIGRRQNADILSQKLYFVLSLGTVKFGFACSAEKSWMYRGLNKPYGHGFLEENLMNTFPITAVCEI